MATVTIPLLFQDVTGGVRRAEVPGVDLAEVIRALDQVYPGLQQRILADGRIMPHVAFTVDGAIASQGLATPVGPHSEVSILPTMGGG